MASPAPVPALDVAPIDTPALQLSVVRDCTLIHLLGDSRRPAPPPALTISAPCDVRPFGPGQWMAVIDARLTAAEIDSVAALVAPGFHVVDQSHGRVRLRLSGPAARDVLAKGTAVDVDPVAFPPGSATGTLFGHIGVHLAAVGPEEFELLVLRSYAASLWEDVRGMAAEFI